MTDLPVDFRAQLASAAQVIDPSPAVDAEGLDGSHKLLFQLSDGERVESVIIPEGERRTACLSSQVGCIVGCKFCATGMMGFRRNLSAGEILGQLFGLEARFGQRMTNIVMMGMGEPLLNHRALFKAVRLICDPDGMGLSRKHLTVSTVGWLPGIEAMISAVQGEGADGVLPRVKLAVSLNCSSDEARADLMPMAARFRLTDVIGAANRYAELVGLSFAVSYLLLSGQNDTPADAERIIRLLKGRDCKVNVMEYNDVGAGYKRTTPRQAQDFFERLQAAGLTVTMRTSRGRDIAAACGQLAGGYEAGAGRVGIAT